MMRLALLVAIFIGSVNAACPPNFVASTTIPGKCYYLATPVYGIDFFNGINYCRSLTHGADVLSIANGFENSEVASLLQSRGIDKAYIGNAFYDNKSHWIATAAGSSNYSNWSSGIHNGNVALITSSGSWDYARGDDDDYVNYIICQIYPDDPTTFTPPPQITCPVGWRPSISVRGKCYQWINIYPLDFFSATRACLTTRIGDSHAELVTLTSQLEMMELSAMGFGDSWTSLTSWEADGHWHWVETLHPTDYFGPYGQPENLGGDCAYFSPENLYGTSCWDSREPEPGPFTVCQYFPDEPPAPTLPGLNCPQNGIASITKPGTCYYVVTWAQDFQSARNACQTLDTGFKYNDLFVPRTLGEYEEVEVIMIDQPSYVFFWLGLTCSNGNWSWISGQPSNITNIWCFGQPDTSPSSSGQCASIDYQHSYNGQLCWASTDCIFSRGAICQSSNTF